MQSMSKRVFSHEYRAEAVKLVTEQGMGVTEAAKKLALLVKTHSRWVRVARAGVPMSADSRSTARSVRLVAPFAEISCMTAAGAITRGATSCNSASWSFFER